MVSYRGQEIFPVPRGTGILAQGEGITRTEGARVCAAAQDFGYSIGSLRSGIKEQCFQCRGRLRLLLFQVAFFPCRI